MNQLLNSTSIYRVGCYDPDIDLFESQYVVPQGVTYNSYVIVDEKVAILDTVDPRKTQEWLANLDEVLGDRQPDYLVVHHMEPDHAGSVAQVAQRYPQMKLIGNAKTFPMLKQFTGVDYTDRAVVVKEGDVVELGEHSLTFVMAPMVHWPEAMVSYEAKEKVLFSADGFGVIMVETIPCTTARTASIKSRPYPTAALASTKRMNSLNACSGRLTSTKLPQVLTTPTAKNNTSRPYPMACNAPWIPSITCQMPPPLNVAGSCVSSVQISASLSFQVCRAEFRLSTIQFVPHHLPP